MPDDSVTETMGAILGYQTSPAVGADRAADERTLGDSSRGFHRHVPEIVQ